MPELTILIPTLKGREALLDRVTAAIDRHYPDAEVIPLHGIDSWGLKLNSGFRVASGDYVSCCCDDTVPLPGCYEAGIAMLEQGAMPASRYLNPDGSGIHPVDEMPHGTPVPWCRSFLLTPKLYEAVGPFIDATWYADWDYSERLKAIGLEILACDGFSFTHLDGPRDWLTPAEDARQRAEYEASHRRQGIVA